jgi:hypothetical protein
MKYAIYCRRIDRSDEIKELPNAYIEAEGLIEAYLIYIKHNIPEKISLVETYLFLGKDGIPTIKIVRDNYIIHIHLNEKTTLQEYVNRLSEKYNND